jgi:carboxymethylenebutenolidase
MAAYLAVPRAGRGAGVVVLQEIFGVNAAMRQVCDFLASRQFTALCPDLFWRMEPGLELDEPEAERARALRAQTKDEEVTADIASAIEFLRRHPASNGSVGVVGCCWGGYLAYLTAVNHKPDAAVGYYGVGIDRHLDSAKSLSCPLMLHYAGLDPRASPEVAAQVRAAFHGDPRVTVHEYPQAGHGFARPGGSKFDAKAADLADMRTLAFLVENLIGHRRAS